MDRKNNNMIICPVKYPVTLFLEMYQFSNAVSRFLALHRAVSHSAAQKTGLDRQYALNVCVSQIHKQEDPHSRLL